MSSRDYQRAVWRRQYEGYPRPGLSQPLLSVLAAQREALQGLPTVDATGEELLR